MPRPAALTTALAAALLAACAQWGGGRAPAAPPAAAARAPAQPAMVGTVPAPAPLPAPAGAASGAAPGAVASGAAPTAARSSAPASALPAFEAVIRDARPIEGTLRLYQKDDRVWLELAEADFGAPLFLSPKLASGIGEGGVLGGLMMSGAAAVARPQVVTFRRVFNQVQLVARNVAYVARPGTPEARAVEAAFSPSLIASVPLASAPHPQRRSVLVDASALFMGDWLAVGPMLQRAFRQGYGYDARNSALLRVRGKPDAVIFEVQNHYTAPSVSGVSGPVLPGLPLPRTPTTLPDARSLFVTLHYSLSRLPAQPMPARAADARIGTFMTTVSDFGDDLGRTPKQRYVNRWRLDKQDPAAELSPPVRPITFWIDRNVPLKYRDAIRAGILAWNQAFERIGFKDAIVVQQQADDADFDTLDVGVPSVRWMTNAAAAFGAIGPSHVDPRSGEILDADVAIESLSSRSLRTLRSQVLAARRAGQWERLLQASDALADAQAHAHAHAHPDAAAWDACTYADFAAEQFGYALDVFAARGQIDPSSPQAEAFVQAYMKDVTMHEIGHALGLRHNFRASRVYSQAQIADPAFTQSHALTGSVMEYAPINLAMDGRPQPAPFQTTLGPYDFWAIEYMYRPLPAQGEREALARIAARSSEPELAFASDEDNALGIDPESLVFDLGDDPLAFARQRFAIAHELLQRLEARPREQASDYAELRRSVAYALRDAGRAAGVLSRQIGGVRTLRDKPDSGREPLVPVPAAQQRAALEVLSREVLSARGLRVSPRLQRQLAPDFLERTEAMAGGLEGVATDYAPQQELAGMQRALLAQLLSDGLAQRLLDSQAKAEPGRAPLGLGELYQRIEADVWTELDAPAGAPRDIEALRRELQRDHLNRLSALLMRPASASRADARAIQRQRARALLVRLQRAASAPGWRADTRMHLRDCEASLREVLAAPLTRSGA